MKKLSYLFSFCLMITAVSLHAQRNCTAEFDYTTNGLTVDFIDSSSSPTGNHTYFWDVLDTPFKTYSSQNPSHTFTGGGRYLVCLTITDSTCSDSICKYVTVSAPKPLCDAEWNYSIDSVDQGLVYFNNLSSLTGATFSWNFGDGTATTPASTSTQQNPSHTYTASGTYWVNMTMIDSIGDTCYYSDSVVISLPTVLCNASFTIEKDTSASFNVILYNNSTNASSHQYHWDFGDGTTGSGRTPIHTYQNFGSYEVCLTITDSILRCDTVTFCDTVGMDSLGNLKAGFGIEVRDAVLVGIDEEQDAFSGVSIFPNPAQNIINVDLRGRNDVVNIRIMDLSGRIVSERANTNSGNLESFDISTFSKGVYFMMLDNGTNQTVEKFIVAN